MSWAPMTAVMITWVLVERLQRTILRREPPPPDAPSLPVVPLSVPMRRVPGRVAHWNPWRQELVIGDQWLKPSLPLGGYVLAHELVHATQPVIRLRLASLWLLALMVASSLGALVLTPNPWWAPTIAGLFLVGEFAGRWRIEDEASRRTLGVLGITDPEWVHWHREAIRRNRWMLTLDSVGWALAVALVALLVPWLRIHL